MLPKQLPELINKFSNIVGHKINVEKSVAFLDTNNESSKREIKEMIPFTITSKRTQYLGIILP